MAYEVTKRVGARAYRYRVESYRDPATSKVRSRWTYLGTVADDGTPRGPVRRPRSERTREGLVDAFEALVIDMPYAELTAGDVAVRAGVAHGTFYRYFGDKRALLLAAIDRVKRDFDRVRPDFSSPLGSLDDERERVRTWLRTLLEQRVRRHAILRRYHEAVESDAELRALRATRSDERVVALTTYIERLVAAQLSTVRDARGVARALTLLVDGAIRSNFADAGAPAALGAGVVEAFDRALFARF